MLIISSSFGGRLSLLLLLPPIWKFSQTWEFADEPEKSILWTLVLWSKCGWKNLWETDVRAPDSPGAMSGSVLHWRGNERRILASWLRFFFLFRHSASHALSKYKIRYVRCVEVCSSSHIGRQFKYSWSQDKHKTKAREEDADTQAACKRPTRATKTQHLDTKKQDSGSWKSW